MTPCTLDDDVTPGPWIVNQGGEFTVAAANGDELYGTFQNTLFAGTNPGQTGAINGTQTFTGGTGRFADASGATITSGTFTSGDPAIPGDLGRIQLDAVGTIIY